MRHSLEVQIGVSLYKHDAFSAGLEDIRQTLPQLAFFDRVLVELWAGFDEPEPAWLSASYSVCFPSLRRVLN